MFLSLVYLPLAINHAQDSSRLKYPPSLHQPCPLPSPSGDGKCYTTPSPLHFLVYSNVTAVPCPPPRCSCGSPAGTPPLGLEIIYTFEKYLSFGNPKMVQWVKCLPRKCEKKNSDSRILSQGQTRWHTADPSPAMQTGALAPWEGLATSLASSLPSLCRHPVSTDADDSIHL